MTEMLSRAGFDIDLREGQAREQALVYVFLKALVEVKSDKRARETGNVFIEFHDHRAGRASGINVTTAHYWAFEYAQDCWLIVPTQRVKALADRRALEVGTVRGGDHNMYDGVLLPLQWLINAAAR